MKKVKLFGASGAGNVGDDLIAVILQKYLQTHLLGTDVSILLQQHEQEVADADALIIGGGGLIYDYDWENVRIYTEMIHLAYSYRIPVFMMGMGVQHVFSQPAIEQYTQALRFVKRIATRSEQDSDFITNKFGYDSQHIITSRDVVFLYEDVFGEVTATHRSSERPTLALSLADWQLGDNYKKIDKNLTSDYQNYREYLQATLPLLGNFFHVKVICQAAQDVAISNEVVRLVGGDAELVTFAEIEDSSKLIEAYQQSDVVITSRYHGLIAAIIAKKPVIGVSFGGHKQQKLIDESFPSLQSQFYTVGDFVKMAILDKLQDKTFRQGIGAAQASEYAACIRLARRHADIAKYIAGEFAKTM
jgi:polysaccharide pyruvyl transferase WcaK-like protein